MLPGKTPAPSDFVQMARRRLWWLILPPVLTTFAALVYSSTVPNAYQSDMLIAIDPQRVPDAFVRSTVTLSTDLRMDAIEVQVMSRTNLERMINEFDLYPDERKTQPLEEVVALMRSNVEVQLERGRPGPRGLEPSNAFHVRFTYHDPLVASRVTQRLGSLFVEQNRSDRRGLAESTNSFLEVQLEEARKSLVVQERRLEAFRERHGNAMPTQMSSNMQAIASSQMQVQSLVESTARDRDRKLMLERLYRDAAAEPSPAPVVSATTTAASASSTPAEQLASAKANLTALELRYRPEHPDVVRAKRLVAQLEGKAGATASASTSATAPEVPTSSTTPERREQLRQMLAEIESLDRQVAFKESEERRIRSEIADYQRRIEAVPGLESEWSALTRDYDTQQTAYKELLAKSGAAKLAVDLEQEQIGENFRIVDPAGVPVQPLSSLRLQINAGGLALGLLVGISIAALLELRDESFRTDKDVVEVLGLPVLASAPYIESAGDRAQRRRRRLQASVAGLLLVVGAGYLVWTLKLWNSLV